MNEEEIRNAVKEAMANPGIRGALEHFGHDRDRRVLDTCPSCQHEFSDNDISPHRCPPLVPKESAE